MFKLSFQLLRTSSGGCGGTFETFVFIVIVWTRASFYFALLFIRSIHTMATGTSNDTELEELKEMVRQMGNRIDILSAAKL